MNIETFMTIRTVFHCVLIAFLISAGGASLKAQNLSEIRREIERLESELRKKESEEQDLLRLVQDLDREIGLRKTLLSRLEHEIQSKERAISTAEKDLSETAERYEKRKELAARRIVALYKKGRAGDLETLLSFENLNQMLVWMRYQKRIIEQDQRNLNALMRKKKEIEDLKRKLDREIAAKRGLVEETEDETVKIRMRKEAQRGPLARIRREESAIRQRLEDQKRIKAVIEKQILEEESKPRTAVRELDGKRFAARKGKLDWPVQGKIAQKYGRQKNPITGILWENNGIDIESSAGRKVSAVADGRVKYIDWQRGMGNLVLVDHGGYYTVYGHMEQVNVNIGQDLAQGQSIGNLGDPDSLYGSMLHFELWNGKNHENPENWLR